MNIERQYLRQLNESINKQQLNEASGYKYAYTTRSRAEDGGWEVANSPEELREEWDEDYGSFNPKRILVMKPATSVDKAMVLVSEPNTGGDVIYPSINDAINGPMGLKELEWEEGEGLTDVTEEDLKELLQTKDLNRAKEILKATFVDAQDYGYFDGLYEYVSGPMPKSDGMTPGKIIVPTSIDSEKQVKDFNYYLKRVEKNPDSFEKVPARFKTPELCKIAVEKWGENLGDVPDKLKTPELCKIAVENRGRSLLFVPDELKTPELCKTAVEDYPRGLEWVPDKLKTPELCKIAVENSGWSLESVPDKLKTPELCKIAVERQGGALKYVPDKLKTPELCRIAIERSSSGFAFTYTPDKFKTFELCKLAVERGCDIEDIPDNLKEQVKQELGLS